MFRYLFARTPSAVFTVVDERTCRKVRRAADEALARGDYGHALAALHSMRIWLRYEIVTGRQSKRPQRTHLVDIIDLELEQVRDALGVT